MHNGEGGEGANRVVDIAIGILTSCVLSNGAIKLIGLV